MKFPKPFPKPRKYGANTTRWDEHELDVYDAEIAGKEPPERTGPKRLLSDVQVAERYNVARVTPWRWAAKRDENKAA